MANELDRLEYIEYIFTRSVQVVMRFYEVGGEMEEFSHTCADDHDVCFVDIVLVAAQILVGDDVVLILAVDHDLSRRR